MANSILAGIPVISGAVEGYRNRFQRWISRRLLPARRHRLRQRNLFIFPTTAGFGYLAVNLLLWLTGTNYENNLVLAVAFLQTALFIVCIHHTFFNLAGLELEVLHSYPGYAGIEAELELLLRRQPGKSKENLQFGVSAQNLVAVDLIDACDASLKLFIPVQRRGWHLPPRILVQSPFPLGLLRCWTWLAFDVRILVYPHPLPGGQAPFGGSSKIEGDLREEQGAEDFHGFRDYQPGMPIRQIAWKQYAAGRSLYSKEYTAPQGRDQWLDWYQMEGLHTEAKLSRLCYWVRRLGGEQPLGLRLPGQSFEPAQGLEHQRRMLRALALFGQSDNRAQPERTCQ